MNEIVLSTPQFPAAIKIDTEWLEKRDNLVAQVQKTIKVSSQEDYETCEVYLKKLTKTSNTAEDIGKKARDPFNNFSKKIKSVCDGACQPLEDEKTRIKKLMSDYFVEQTSKRNTEIEQKASEAAKDEFADLAPIKIDIKPVERLMSAAVKMWRFEVTEPTMVPREFCSPDDKKIREYVNANKAAAEIPGVRVWEEVDIRAR